MPRKGARAKNALLPKVLGRETCLNSRMHAPQSTISRKKT